MVVDVAYFSRESKEKGKFSRCDHCKKNLDMKRKNSNTRESLNASSAEDLGI